jgi:hypothetical protein
LGAVSGWRTSNSVAVNSKPPTPNVVAPVNGSITYNRQPRVLLKLGAKPDGEEQMLSIQNAYGAWGDSVKDSANFSHAGWLADNTAVRFQHESIQIGTNYTISAKTKDKSFQEESGTVSRTFSVFELPIEKIIANETAVKSDHIITLRTAINNIRHYYGLTTFVWQESIISGRTQISRWTWHVLELRGAINEVIAFINGFDTSQIFTVSPLSWIPIEYGRPKAAVMAQICEVISTI